MRRHGVWLLPLLPLLMGCASGGQDTSPEAACRRQAYDDPAVKHILVESLGDAAATAQGQFEYNLALHNATDACLRQKGVQVRGGVEPVQPH